MGATLSIVVVGAGVFGLSSAIDLARRGHTVTLMDPGPIPHPRAASTDISKAGLVYATGGSGHAFKFTPVLGRIVADVVERKPNAYSSRFAWREPTAQAVKEQARFKG